MTKSAQGEKDKMANVSFPFKQINIYIYRVIADRLFL